MMAAPIRDETDTVLVRFFRTRRRPFQWLLWLTLSLVAIFILVPALGFAA